MPTWSIDTSNLDPINLACDWYDKAIREFPQTDVARKAHIEKFRTILGKEGIKLSFGRYIDPLLTAYHEFEKAFPDDDNLPAMKYQIAQVYWRQGIGHLRLSEVQKTIAEGREYDAKREKEFADHPSFLAIQNGRKIPWKEPRSTQPKLVRA